MCEDLALPPISAVSPLSLIHAMGCCVLYAVGDAVMQQEEKRIDPKEGSFFANILLLKTETDIGPWTLDPGPWTLGQLLTGNTVIQ
jgi:hypothetical protein